VTGPDLPQASEPPSRPDSAQLSRTSRIGYTIRVDRKHLSRALDELRDVPDPYVRLQEARDLDEALKVARIMVANIKHDTVRALRADSAGYGTIGRRLGLSRGRVQQLAGAPVHPLLTAAAYAFRDELDQWHGEPGMLPAGSYQEASSFIPFSPADVDNPLYGQVLTVRYGGVPKERGVTAYTLQIRLRDGSPRNLRMTEAVQDALFGPPIVGSPERAEWEKARDRRARERAARGSQDRPETLLRAAEQAAAVGRCGLVGCWRRAISTLTPAALSMALRPAPPEVVL